MNKHFLLTLCVVCFAVPALAQETSTDSLHVFNAQTNEISSLLLDPSLDFLEGNIPQGTIEAQPACIVGGEDWEQHSPDHFPYSATVFLTLDNGRGSCSGAMVGNYTVLTAAHCVLQNPNFNMGKLHDPKGIHAFAGGSQSELQATATNIFIPEEVRHVSWGKEFAKHDYAIIVLDKPLGQETGYFGVQKTSVAVNEQIAVLGFPGQRDHLRPWYSPGKVLKVEEGVFYHDADILPGNSGGPTVKSSNLRNIIGVVSFEQPAEQINGSSKPADQALVSFVSQLRHTLPIATPKRPSVPPHVKGPTPPLQLPPGIFDSIKRKPQPTPQFPQNILEQIRRQFKQKQ